MKLKYTYIAIALIVAVIIIIIWNFQPVQPIEKDYIHPNDSVLMEHSEIMPNDSD